MAGLTAEHPAADSTGDSTAGSTGDVTAGQTGDLTTDSTCGRMADPASGPVADSISSLAAGPTGGRMAVLTDGLMADPVSDRMAGPIGGSTTGLVDDSAAELTVDFHARPERTLTAADRLSLDRDFLSGGADERLSRTPSAPALRHMGGQWWLVNGHDNATPVVVYATTEGRRFTVGERCAFPLPDGESEVTVGGHRVRVLVSTPATASPQVPEAITGPETSIGLSGAAVRVQLLFGRKPRHRAVLAAHYREYFTPGVESPKPLERRQTRLCMGLTSHTALERALNEVVTEIWGEPVGHRHELPDYLIRERLLVAADQDLVPHRFCRHTAGPPRLPPVAHGGGPRR
ncbi:hypothetical protein L6E12_15050 [Actinokineospora sp. PR83]|uniref:hypothetical protein n=1 Tax=Actinokineospora sp. PR83 TaxID=2884908 RepID=UPI001F1959F9|nr:hypothetical protein [Actinokineospora sp. PR83]MCG8917107.1 hypothetical protein [Actinokineospora sp. PR83]